MIKKEYEEKILKKYGSWENDINSNVLYFYKFIDSIDKGIVDFLKILNNHGYHTVFSCSGHSEDSVAYIDFATYITIDKIIYGMLNLFNADKSKYFITYKVLPNGVSLLRLVIPPDSKDYFNIKSFPKKLKREV